MFGGGVSGKRSDIAGLILGSIAVIGVIAVSAVGVQ